MYRYILLRVFIVFHKQILIAGFNFSTHSCFSTLIKWRKLAMNSLFSLYSHQCKPWTPCTRILQERLPHQHESHAVVSDFGHWGRWNCKNYWFVPISITKLSLLPKIYFIIACVERFEWIYFSFKPVWHHLMNVRWYSESLLTTRKWYDINCRTPD